MIKIKNRQLQTVAILENAYAVGYEKSFNSIWKASFSLPLDDEKVKECKPLNLVEVTDNGEYIGLFRIVPSLTVKNESGKTITFQCEHVLATLLDDVMFKYHDRINMTTTQVLTYLLNQQTTKHWKLGTVAFTRYFHYKWENENLLSALFSVPKPFNQNYQWTWDTQSYPWTLNLVQPETEPTCEIREQKNLIGLEREEDPSGIFNRIYALGYGEGDNQLTFAEMNGGKPYVEDAESIAKYGLKSHIWVDRRFEDMASLKGNAEGLLNAWKDPKITWRVNAADLSSLSGKDIDKLRMGRICRIHTEEFGIVDARIMKESKSDMLDKPWDIPLEIANKLDDIATLNTDMRRKQEINEVYSQGATNIDSYDYSDNADSLHPAIIRFFVPEEMVRINKLLLRYETTEFRTYGGTTQGGGGTTATSTSGGGTTATSTSGGGVSTSTQSGGGTSQTSGAGGDHTHKMFTATGFETNSNPNTSVSLRAANGHHILVNDGTAAGLEYYTEGSSGNHQHNVTFPAHSHDFSVPNHAHNVTIPNHAHDVTIPPHTHEIDHGIFKLDRLPSSVTIIVDGNVVPGDSLSGENVDLIPYLAKDSEGKVSRGAWHTVEVLPNDLARIQAQITAQFFIQSRGPVNV
ncbi:hypothetical protein BhaS171_00024 [Bacillus phage vB_BhaS-171]|uniref:minor head protein n=1 Tax=Bacillus phage vB_BhaS-171 TaxID=1775140 RepID=UPI0007448C6F|nr:minor head protein [Bacillus phage vB_BhaS-171]ALY08080.1 hypothetical protein BhaS171_00024 [Bacillus phage vB_BhaS-171]